MNGLDSGRESISELTPVVNTQPDGNDTSILSRIQQALEIVHGPYSTRDSRREASEFLDQIKSHNEAPCHGFTLASDKTQQPIVRHFSLSLIEHAIRYRWLEYSQAESKTLRDWVINLAQNIQHDDQTYLRSKIAQLWIEVAMRSWGTTWMDLDEILFSFWDSASLVHKEFVLSTLESLSEEAFTKEEATCVVRGDMLQKCCVEIFTPEIALIEAFSSRGRRTVVRFRDEGWLIRIGEFLEHILEGTLYQDPLALRCLMKCLSIYKSLMPWALSKALACSSCVHYLIKTLATPNIKIQIASIEALHSCFNRTQFSDEDFLTLVCPILTSQNVDLLRKLFGWSAVDPRDIDDEKYLFAKKLSEMISNIGNLVQQKFRILPEECDLPNLFNLLLSITQSQSFFISIPILHTWTRLLRSDHISDIQTFDSVIGPLLELASSRLIRYDIMPENSEDPSMIFLLEDVDTVAERHAFLGNYRRYNIQIIELIVRQKQSEAIYHLFRKVDQSVQQLFEAQAPFCVETYSKNSYPALQLDAQFTIIEATLRAYMKLVVSNSSKFQQGEQSRSNMEDFMEAWCERLITMNFMDPIIRKRVLQLAVAFSTSVLNKKISFMLKVLEQILMNKAVEHQGNAKYTEAVKEMQTDSLYELQRLAINMPDYLLDVYEQLEEIINKTIVSESIDFKREISFRTFLFTIIHRNTKLAPEIRYQKLNTFIDPIKNSWQCRSLHQALISFDSFCDYVGLTRVKKFLNDRRVHEIKDWGLYQLDSEGHDIQLELDKRLKALPLRATKTFLHCGTDRLSSDALELKFACKLWKDITPIILPSLLSFLRYAHAIQNPKNWIGLSSDMTPAITHILSDRFWQAGISSGSKEEFYARVSDTKSTLEGLASTVRGSIRIIREAAYGILYCISKVDDNFYSMSDLPGPLAVSLFEDAHFLSSHQLINLLQVVRAMIDECPAEHRENFVPIILSSCFTQIDLKCTTQWKKLTLEQSSSTVGENLTDEMKEESLLRQLLYTSVSIIGAFFDPQRIDVSNDDLDANSNSLNEITSHPKSVSWPSMRDFCLSSTKIIEPVLILLSHAITIHDTRSCGIVLRIFRSIIPEFSRSKPREKVTDDTGFLSSIREFISREILMACIQSLNEPYFVEMQKDLAQCIVSILVWYCQESTTPRQILLSIPNIQELAVDRCLQQINQPSTQPRTQRELVLELFSEIKGVRISEQGRIKFLETPMTKGRSKLQQDFTREQAGHGTRIGSPILEGLTSMFEEG